MPASVYALLVGINTYPAPVPPLAGCVNDVQLFENYLTTLFTPPQLHLQTLLDGAATRAAVIQGFREHLRQADKDAIALFYFAGHGSQQRVRTRQAHDEPDDLCETLVCWDSRVSGGWDLVDKELAILINELSLTGANIVVVLDCCHSGTATRSSQAFRPRYLAPSETVRSDETLLEVSISRSLSGSSDGRHILIAACQDDEEALETQTGLMSCGIFTQGLLRCLHANAQHLTYRTLYEQVCAHVHHLTLQQTPRLEVTLPEDMDQLVLNGALHTRRPYFTLSFQANVGWTLHAGLLHGLQPSETATLALYPYEVHDLTQRDASVTTATLTQVGVHQSVVAIQDAAQLERGRAYKAVLVERGQSLLQVQGLHLLPAADLDQAYIAAADAGQPYDVRLTKDDAGYTITPYLDTARRLENILSHQVGQTLLRIAHTTLIRHLSNPDPHSLGQGSVRLSVQSLIEGTPPLWESQTQAEPYLVPLSYQRVGDRWQFPRFKIGLTNHASQTLYCALLYLELDSCEPLLRGGTQQLQPGQSVTARMGGRVDDASWEQGVYEARESIKWIVCTQPFDANALIHMRATRGSQTSLIRQLLPPATRGAVDWLAGSLQIIIHRPPDAAPEITS